VSQEGARELRQVEAPAKGVIQERQCRRWIASRDRRTQRHDQASIGHTQHRRGLLFAEPPFAGGQHLIEQRQRVAHRASPLAGNDVQRAGIELDRFAGQHIGEVLDQASRRHQLEVVALHAREDGLRQLVRIGGGKDEQRVRRRLFQRLEQRVEGAGRQHVDFVEDVELLFAAHRGVADRLAQLADVLDAVLRGGVDLLHID
jgi:hypothetical protein